MPSKKLWLIAPAAALSLSLGMNALVAQDKPAADKPADKPAAAADAPAAKTDKPAEAGKSQTTASGLKITVVEEAKNPGAMAGDIVWVHYTGKLSTGGEPFDSSVGRQPFKFTLGQGQVIKGWDEGVAGMKVGEKRQLTIPAELGYGAQGSPPKIPGGATLVFDVEMIGLARPGK